MGERVEGERRRVAEVQSRLDILQTEKECKVEQGSRKGISVMEERVKEKEKQKKTNSMVKKTKRKTENENGIKMGQEKVEESLAGKRASLEKVVINVGGVKHEVSETSRGSGIICWSYETTWM